MIYKKELRQKLNVCSTTLRTLLNNIYYEELKLLGYKKTQHQLTPKQYSFLIDSLGINE